MEAPPEVRARAPGTDSLILYPPKACRYDTALPRRELHQLTSSGIP